MKKQTILKQLVKQTMERHQQLRTLKALAHNKFIQCAQNKMLQTAI